MFYDYFIIFMRIIELQYFKENKSVMFFLKFNLSFGKCCSFKSNLDEMKSKFWCSIQL